MLELKEFKLYSLLEKKLDIDHIVFKNNSYCIIGKNNSGKSLLLKTLYEHYKMYDGSIIFNNKPYPIKKNTENSRLLIELETQLLLNSTIKENILLPFSHVPDSLKTKMNELINIASLENYTNSPCNSISFSQKKLTEIIRAVLQKPKLLLIDDFDLFFDDREQIKGIALLNLVNSYNGILIISSRHKLPMIEESYYIYEHKLVKI